MFTITCSENVTLPMMLQYMAGMVQTGCWALFDDTDRLTKGMISLCKNNSCLGTISWYNNTGHPIKGTISL